MAKLDELYPDVTQDNSKPKKDQSKANTQIKKTGQRRRSWEEPIEEKQTPISSMIMLRTDECEPWEFADRGEYEMGDITALAKSIAHEGQKVPILIRRSIKSSKKYEIIYGHRRWRACKSLGKEVQAIVEDLDDKEAASAQKVENENRKNICDYSRALSYKKMLDHKLFNTEKELADFLKLSKQTLNDLMAFARIPGAIVDKIHHMHELPLTLAVKIASLSKDSSNIEHIVAMTTYINQKKVTLRNFDKIFNDIANGESVSLTSNEVIYGRNGAKLFSVRVDANGAPCFVVLEAGRKVLNLDKVKETLTNIAEGIS